MRKSKLIVLAGVVVLGLASVLWSEAPTTVGMDLEKENAKLRSENEELKQQVKKLEKKLADQRKWVTTRPFDWRMDPGILPPNFRPTTRPYSFRLTPSKPMFPGARSYNLVPDENQVPGNWEKREFNGQPFYIIPLGASASKAPSP